MQEILESGKAKGPSSSAAFCESGAAIDLSHLQPSVFLTGRSPTSRSWRSSVAPSPQSNRSRSTPTCARSSLLSLSQHSALPDRKTLINRPQKKLVDYCQSKGILVEAYSPLGSTSSPILEEEEIVAIAKAHNASSASVLLSWLSESPPCSPLA